MEKNLEAQKVSFEDRAARARDRAISELNGENLQAEVLPGMLMEAGFRDLDAEEVNPAVVKLWEKLAA